MATNWPLLVEVDCPEPRPDLGRVCVGADGTSWDRAYSTGWFDSVTNTVMPAPLPVTEVVEQFAVPTLDTSVDAKPVTD